MITRDLDMITCDLDMIIVWSTVMTVSLFTVNFRPIRKEIVSSMYNNVNYSYDNRPNWTPLGPITIINKKKVKLQKIKW